MRYTLPSWLLVALILAVTNEAVAAGCHMVPLGSQDASNKTSGPTAAGNEAPYEQTLAGQGNSAVYSWSHDNVWNLAYTFNDPQAGARLPTSDDYVETYTPNSNGSATPSSSICDPITLPSVRVIAPYTGGWSQYVVVTNREPPPSGGGGFWSIFRKPSVIKGEKQADTDLTCANSDDATRSLAAREAIATSTTPYNRRGIYVIKFGPGTSQKWLVTEPYATTLGLVPAGECTGP